MGNEINQIRIASDVGYDGLRTSEHSTFHKDRAHANGPNTDFLCFKITNDVLECVRNDEGSKLKDVANWLRHPKKTYKVLNAPGKENKVFDKIIEEVNVKIAKHNGSGLTRIFRMLTGNYIKPIENGSGQTETTPLIKD